VPAARSTFLIREFNKIRKSRAKNDYDTNWKPALSHVNHKCIIMDLRNKTPDHFVNNEQ
jgi:hypothetical protein